MLKIMSRVLLLKIIRMNRLLPYMRNRVGVLVLILVAMSCTGNDIYLPDSGAKDYPVSLNAGYPGPDTRLSVDGTVVGWDKENDKIKIVAASADKKTGTSELTVYEVSNNGKTASFTGFVSMDSMPEYCYFMYPVHNSMTVNPETEEISVPYNNQSGKHEPFMYARTKYDAGGFSGTFSHIGAMLEITCKIKDVQQLTFAGNELEPLSPVIVNSKTGDISDAKEANVQITVPVQTEGKTYIAVPPVNMEKGFSIICSNADGSKSMIKTFSSDGKLSSGYNFAEKVGSIIPITLTGTLEPYNVTSSEPQVVHTKTQAGLLNGTTITFSMNKTGVSDKLIEEWGATLVNSDGQKVREITLTNANPPKGQTVTMDISNEWKLLRGGTYTFAPFYKIYGQKISLASQTVTVEDPGVKLEIHGQTSFDKYKAGDVDGPNGANSHTNTLIEGVAVTTNVDLNIISEYSATLDGSDMGKVSVTSGTVVTASYGNLTKTEYKKYSMKVSYEIGPWKIEAERDFHITGLPMEVDFTAGDPTSGNWTQSQKWGYLGIAGYSNKWVTFKKGTGALMTPELNIPENITVKTAIDANTNCSNESDRVIMINACPSDSYSPLTSSTKNYTPDYSAVFADGLKSQGYGDAMITDIDMSSDNNALMYSNVIDDEAWYLLDQTRVGIFKIKIQYQ